MRRNSVDQSNSVVSDNAYQAGRDNNITINNYGEGENILSNLRIKMIKLEEELKRDAQLNQIKMELEGHADPEDRFAGKSLEEKLIESGREAEIDRALRLKEIFAKKLGQFQFSKSAQEIFGSLLALTEQRFNNLVRPKIDDGLSKHEIDSLWHKEIVEGMGTITDIGPLNLNASHLGGMVYYLTGNCWIKWS